MKFKRFLTVICICSLCICLSANVKARADAFPSASEILTLRPGVELTGIANAYESLNSEQKLIACYIIGAFNNIYLCARGFRYNIDQNETTFKAQFIAMGQLVWNYAVTAYGWKSRFNETFRQYLSSAVVYASGINSTFEAWYTGIKQGGANQLYIPYSKDAFDAWTEWYNDPSGDGIASLGTVVSEWDSGTLYDFAFTGIPWYAQWVQDDYNNFILNNSPVMYSQSGNNSGYSTQLVFSVKNIDLPNALFILRSSNGSYNQFRFGYSNFSFISNFSRRGNYYFVRNNKIEWVNYFDYGPRVNTITYSGTHTLDELVSYAFNITPFDVHYQPGGWSNFAARGFYPYIQHVYLTDDLTNLTNIEEIFDTEGLNIESPGEAEARYIISPNGLFLSPTWPTADGDPMGFWDIIQDNSYNVDTQLPATDDDFNKTIINNTTINNYYVTDSDQINVPVEWFENELTDQLAQDSIPFLQFARDCIDCLGDLQIYLYGAVVFGLAGGVLKKFLL